MRAMSIAVVRVLYKLHHHVFFNNSGVSSSPLLSTNRNMATATYTATVTVTVDEIHRLFPSEEDKDIRGFLVRVWNDAQVSGAFALGNDAETKEQLRAFWKEKGSDLFYSIESYYRP